MFVITAFKTRRRQEPLSRQINCRLLNLINHILLTVVLLTVGSCRMVLPAGGCGRRPPWSSGVVLRGL